MYDVCFAMYGKGLLILLNSAAVGAVLIYTFTLAYKY
jgi:hypothetical protein